MTLFLLRVGNQTRVNALKFYIIKNACKTKVDLIY